jgi:hypothetical protein
MLLFVDRKGAPAGEPGGMAELNKFAGELASQRKLRRGMPLLDESAGARVRVRDGKAFVSDGPFAESKEVVGGFWIIEVASRGEAIEIARRAFELGEPRPDARHGVIEVHLARGREAVADPGQGVPFLLAYRMEPGLTDPDGSKMREMIAYGEALKREGRFVETAPLAKDPPPARIEASGGKTLVIDGPFAEAKEVVGGYGLVRAAGREEAIELAVRCPHAKWGSVEVREIIDPA